MSHMSVKYRSPLLHMQTPHMCQMSCDVAQQPRSKAACPSQLLRACPTLCADLGLGSPIVMVNTCQVCWQVASEALGLIQARPAEMHTAVHHTWLILLLMAAIERMRFNATVCTDLMAAPGCASSVLAMSAVDHTHHSLLARASQRGHMWPQGIITSVKSFNCRKHVICPF